MYTYRFTVESFIRSLTALKGILEKGKHFADEKKVDFGVLLQTRLSPDQFSLGKQVQVSSDLAKAFVGRVTTIQPPVFADTEITYDEFQTRLDVTIAFLKTVKPEDIQTTARITFPWYPGKFLSADDYITQYILPNFYFHVTTVYAILRSCGVELGKADYMTGLNWQDVAN